MSNVALCKETLAIRILPAKQIFLVDWTKMGKRRRNDNYDEMLESLEPPTEERRRKSKKTDRRKEKFAEERKWSFDLKPRTENQRLAMKYFASKPMVVLEGSAGSGKSTLATAWACRKLVDGSFDRFVVTRNAIGIGKSVGFFPGTATEKCSIWMANVLGMCRSFVGKGTVDLWMKGESPKLVLEPTEVLRGQSFERTMVLIEEAQQLSIEEIKCISTRLGENSLMVFTGDTKQRDIQTNGLDSFCRMVEKNHIDEVGVVRFTDDDIVRSGLVRKLVKMFNREGI